MTYIKQKKTAKLLSSILVFVLLIGCKKAENQPLATSLRAPSYPLVTIDPYTSVWSFTDKLYDEPTKHWTGTVHPLIGAVRVDGQVYRFLGKETIRYTPVVKTAATEPWEARYTFKEPSGTWEKNDFDDSGWKEGKAAFGTSGMDNLATLWETKDVWVRRKVMLEEDLSARDVYLEYSHDDIFELYINGIQVVKTGYEWKNNVIVQLSEEVKKTLSKGENYITAHCHNRTGGGYVDFGLLVKKGKSELFDVVAYQQASEVLPTQTCYTFQCGPVQLNLTFTSPLLLDNLNLVSRPVNYINYSLKSLDGQDHDVQIYFETTPQWAVNKVSQEVTYDKYDKDGLCFLKTGTVSQKILATKGDNVRIDWGYFYLVGDQTAEKSFAIGDIMAVKEAFVNDGKLSGKLDKSLSPKMAEQMLALAYSHNLGTIGSKETGGYLMIGYDDLYSIQYFGENLMPWWKKDGASSIEKAFAEAANERETLMKSCQRFNGELMSEAEKTGGRQYAELCALAYRQAIAAHKLVEDKNGEILFLSKENFSNGSIGTVDVTYPSAPLFLRYNPELLKGMLNPIFYYSESGKWTKPFAAHDVGTYPIANGQTYGGDMPVEECGNMLILTAAIAKKEGNANYAKEHWEVLTTWADYLLENGLDPENQLCTDDFAGHFAHNVNLSVKAIMAIAGYGRLAEMLGKKELGDKYTNAARNMAKQWTEMAADGDHYRLTFDQPGTWSQKYNLVWDKLLGLNIFSPEVAEKEVAWYLTRQNVYGLPLDSRKTYTKSDWIFWTATLAKDKEAFEQLIAPVWRYANETQTRMPLSDWHETTNANSVGFRARSVVGGYFIKLLEDKKQQ